MTRWLVILGLAFAFAVAAPMGFEAEARAKRCVETTMEGKKVKWMCKAKQSCCFNWFAYKGACCTGM
jgi:hypothetical protein